MITFSRYSEAAQAFSEAIEVVDGSSLTREKKSTVVKELEKQKFVSENAKNHNNKLIINNGNYISYSSV
jgi:hypothetical protein